MNYQIIKNEVLLREFIKWLPELLPSEQFYLALFARSKYCNKEENKLSADKQQLKSFTSNKEMLFRKIKQLECEFGSYMQKDKTIPSEALVLYINPNPRSFEVAAKKTLIELANLITKPYSGYNPHKIAMSSIQQSCGRKIYFDFDFDNLQAVDVIEEIKKIVNIDCCKILNTRGGFHLLVKTAKIAEEFKKTWYQSISKINNCDVRGTDILLPVIGCTQGGFTPYFMK